MLSSLAHSSLEVHCSYRLKFFVAKNHLRSSSLSNCSLLSSRFARSCSTRPSQRSKYTEGVVLRMRICIAVQRLSRKCVQKKKKRPVWLVRFQPDHLFPHPWLAWRRQIRPMLGKCPWHAHSVVTCCNIIRDGCEQCESSNNFPFFQPNNLRRVWLVRLANDRKTETSAMAQQAERVDVHACKTLSSGLREASFRPKNSLRTNLIASKFHKFSGGHGSQGYGDGRGLRWVWGYG